MTDEEILVAEEELFKEEMLQTTFNTDSIEEMNEGEVIIENAEVIADENENI